MMEHKFLIVTEGMNPFELTEVRHRPGRVERSIASRGSSRSSPSPPRAVQSARAGRVWAISHRRARPSGCRVHRAAIRASSSRSVRRRRIPDDELGQVLGTDCRNLASGRSSPRRGRVPLHRHASIRRPIIGASTSDCSNGRSGSRSTAANSAQLRVKGMVSGVVWLDDNQNADRDAQLGAVGGVHQDVQARHCQARSRTAGYWRPRRSRTILKVNLEKDPNPPAGDRGYYKLTVRVPSTKENTGSVRGAPGAEKSSWK